MAATNRRTRANSIDQQMAFFRVRYPHWTFRWSDRPRAFSAYGTIEPAPGWPEFQIRIDVEANRVPTVWVEAPTLTSRDGDPQRIPHLYRDGSICCFFPAEDWNSGMLVADFVPGRAAQWLYHYELWLATGHWAGSGTHGRGGRRFRRMNGLRKEDLDG